MCIHNKEGVYVISVFQTCLRYYKLRKRSMLKKIIYTWIVVREWKECGEFRGIHEIVVVDEYACAWIISLLFAKEKVKVCYLDRQNFTRKYRKRIGRKWIVSKNSVESIEQYGTDIIVLPVSFRD